MPNKVCPQCGAVQQWEIWQRCHCGYDFGPPLPEVQSPRESTDRRSRYHTFWPRFLAGFVDGFVFIPLSLCDGFLSAPERGPLILIAWGVISYTAYWLYSVLLHARYGQTLGKMVTHIKVLDLSEERIPTFRQSLIRDSGYIVLNTLSLAYFIYLVIDGQYIRGAVDAALPAQILGWAGLGWFLLEITSMAASKKRRAFHDYIAKTVVVREPL